MPKVPDLRNAIIKAWDNTEPCPDGIYFDYKFCPSCLAKSLYKYLAELEALKESMTND